MLKNLVLVTVLLVLAACGGGSEGSVNDKTFINPVAKAAALANNVAIVGEAVSFRDGGSSDADAEVGQFFSYRWDFGDGNSRSGRGLGNVEHTYTQAGLYTAVLRVIDADGLFDEDELKIRVAERRVDVAGALLVEAGGGNQRFTRDSDINDSRSGVANISNNSELAAQYIEAPVVITGYLTSPNAILDGFLEENEETLEELLTNTGGVSEGIFAALLGNIPALFAAILDILEIFTGATLNQGFDEYDYYQLSLEANQTISLNTLAYEADKTAFSLALVPLTGTGAPIITRGEAAIETIEVDTSGDYYLVVCPVKGRGKYLLDVAGADDIGLASTAIDTSTLVPGQAVVQYKNSMHLGPKLEQLGTHVRRTSSVVAPAPIPTCYEHLAINFADHYQKLQTVGKIQAMQQAEGVAWVEPNFKRQLSSTTAINNDGNLNPLSDENTPAPPVNDPLYGQQTHHPAINSKAMWDHATGENTIVAIIDNGFKLDHEDLDGQFVTGYDFVSQQEFAGDGDGIDSDPSDPGIINTSDQEPNWHGTFLAGVVAAKANNNLGGAGVSYDAKIMPLRALAGEFGYSYDIIHAMRYAAGLPNASGTLPVQAADIINMSFGSKGFSRAEQELINQLRGMGIFVVAAAGNNKSSIEEYPAAYDNVLSVGAVSSEGVVTVYSKSAAWVDIYAFGGSVQLGDEQNLSMVLSTSSDNLGEESEYRRLYGTSIAAAQVSAAIANMKQAFPGLKPGHFDQLKDSGAVIKEASSSSLTPVISGSNAIAKARELANGSLVLKKQVLASPSKAHIGPLARQKSLDLVPQVSSSFNISSITTDTSWLSARVENNRLIVEANDAGLGSGFLHIGAVTVNFSDAERLTVPVEFKIQAPSLGDIPRVHFKLWDLDLQQELVIDAEHADGSVYSSGNNHSFNLKGVPEGRYCLYYSSDIDGSQDKLCDVGEFCGTYGSFTQPRILTVDRIFNDLRNPDDSAMKLTLLTPKRVPATVDFTQCQ